jgi:glutathione S-transferase
MTDGRAKLYVILGSHACRTGMLMLEHKGIQYERVTIPIGLQRALPALGFPGGTVPALMMNGERVQTNRKLARFLDELQPEPPLLPGEPEVEEAEAWSDEVLQMVARRLAIAGMLRGPEVCPDRGGRGRLGPILWRRPRARTMGFRGVSRLFDVTPVTEQRLLDGLPSMLDRIDAWIEAGVLNGERLNAADYAIASNLALITYRADLRPEIESRPAGALVDRVLPAPI